MKLSVHHWRYDDGWHNIPPLLATTEGAREFREELIGYHCWVYSDNDVEFEKWMKRSMTGKYDTTFRFNSGDPMTTVWIKESVDATLFKLTWM